MSALLDRYEEILRRTLSELIALYGSRLVSVAVFGSVGRGTPRRDSDVDVLLVTRDLPRGRTARVEEFLPIDERMEAWSTLMWPAEAPLVLSPVFKTPAEVEAGSLLFLDMIEDARILYDEGGFFRAYLDRFHGRLQALGSRRIWRGNTWYWELKPDLKPGEVFTL